MDADVIVIGAGAAGAAVSWRLAEAGFSVLCVEQGDFQDPLSYPSTNSDWELRKLTSHSPFPSVRNNSFDYPINDEDSPIAIANFNGVGGSTVLYSGHFPRFHPSDFRTRTLDGVGEDWPISYSDLESYFALNDHMMGVSGLEGDPAYPTISGHLPPVPMGRMGERLASGFNKLGWHWWPSYSAIVTRNTGRRSACVNLGPCNTGCSQSAKSSVDVTYWPEALSMGVNLMTRTRVIRLVEGHEGEVRGVEVVTSSGDVHELTSRAVIVACNGVGTPRLLLNSPSRKSPAGMANSSDLVGRNLMLHPLGYVEGLFDDDLESHLGPQGCCIASHEFYETSLDRDFRRGFSFQILRGPSPVETALSGTLRREIPWGVAHHEAFRKRFGRLASMSAIIEDLPELSNRVTLDAAQVDAYGMPAAKVSYAMSENSKKMMSFALQRGRELMLAAGSTKTYGFGPVRETGWHLMGTTRMGDDPTTSVVNRYGRCHDVPNLYVADSSVFVTAGAVNPTSTLQAVALWIADGVARDLVSGAV